ncbi:YdeI/OmpD-associated family protein [Pseudoalteromonas sp. ZZD1]|uniref:YdeI/OmpD-associated family protein n=1 Tax=Pseudoalteromonas sp. ZZD1 TaxID=3139395 RepID=UPI003BABDE13
MQFPDDFLQTLVSKPDTQMFFDSLSKSNKLIIYYALSSAKKNRYPRAPACQVFTDARQPAKTIVVKAA